MSEFARPRSVWISPAVIGQSSRTSQSAKLIGNSTTGIHSLDVDTPFLSATEHSATVETGEPETEDKSWMTEPVVEDYDDAAVQMLAAAVPLPDSDPNEAEALESAEITAQEPTTPLEIDNGELTSPSKEWHSPTYSDEGMAARMWVSPKIAEYERWMAVKANLKVMELIPRSPYVPRTFAEWLTLRAEMTDIKVGHEISRTASLELTSSSRCRPGICENN